MFQNLEVHQLMYLDIIGDIEEIETLAVGGRIRDIMRIRKQYGPGRWRKLKGVAKVRLSSGRICNAEIHWYEAHGIGRKKMKIKRILD
jgi:hypothetical protein